MNVVERVKFVHLYEYHVGCIENVESQIDMPRVSRDSVSPIEGRARYTLLETLTVVR